ncbi:hypothetical protein SUGI_0357430 [Cryptomeria japonica]|nr:hypothetical protein SUGI_0357430 [Cryptomeria japonica]
MRGKLSVKVDVYSFGVQVLEIVTGRKSTDINFPSQMDSLLEWEWKQFNGGNNSSSKSHASTSKSSWEVEENEKRMTYQISGQLRHLHQGFVQ